jgi:hypothetical protein
MADRTANPARTDVDSDGASLAAREYPSTPVRELAQRQSGTLEVLLLWHAQTDLVELSVRDVATGGGFHTEVAPGRAIDAFYHPYVYAPENRSSYRLDSGETASVDG